MCDLCDLCFGAWWVLYKGPMSKWKFLDVLRTHEVSKQTLCLEFDLFFDPFNEWETRSLAGRVGHPRRTSGSLGKNYKTSWPQRMFANRLV